jgi:pimeloyl-ACP methyl ester carboxylesterase
MAVAVTMRRNDATLENTSTLRIVTRRRVVLSLAVLLVGLAVAAGAAPWIRSAESRVLDDSARANAPGSFAELGHGAVHYLDEGPRDGRPVVLVHGFSVPSYTWDRVATALVAAGFRTIRFDLYGRGYSARPDVDYDRDLFVGQIHELFDALAIQGPVDLVGLSMGGAIVPAYAADHPERVARVVLMAPFNTPAEVGMLAWPGIGEWINAVVFVPGLPEGQRADFVEPDDYPEWPQRYRVQMHYRGFTRAILSTVRHFGARDPIVDFERLGAHGIPVLLLWGERDIVVPSSQSARVTAALGAPRFVLLPDAGHALHYEHADEVNRELIDFLLADRD